MENASFLIIFIWISQMFLQHPLMGIIRSIKTRGLYEQKTVIGKIWATEWFVGHLHNTMPNTVRFCSIIFLAIFYLLIHNMIFGLIQRGESLSVSLSKYVKKNLKQLVGVQTQRCIAPRCAFTIVLQCLPFVWCFMHILTIFHFIILVFELWIYLKYFIFIPLIVYYLKI